MKPLKVISQQERVEAVSQVCSALFAEQENKRENDRKRYTNTYMDLKPADLAPGVSKALDVSYATALAFVGRLPVSIKQELRIVQPKERKEPARPIECVRNDQSRQAEICTMYEAAIQKLPSGRRTETGLIEMMGRRSCHVQSFLFEHPELKKLLTNS